MHVVIRQLFVSLFKESTVWLTLYLLCICFFLCLWFSFLPCQKASCDRPSSDGELTHENGHGDCKDQGESPQEQ